MSNSKMWILFWVCVGNLYIMFPVKPPFVSLHVQYMQYQYKFSTLSINALWYYREVHVHVSKSQH